MTSSAIERSVSEPCAKSVFLGRQRDVGNEHSEADPDATSPMDGAEDWDMVSPDEVPPARVNQTGSPYLDFQLITHLGQLSLMIQPLPEKSNSTPNMPPDESKPINPQTQSPFFTLLPPELRLRIYGLHLRPPPPTNLDPPVHTTKIPIVRIINRHPSHNPSSLTLLLTCRLVLSEAEGIFYSTNRLSTGALGFFRSLGPRRREAITTFALPAQSPAQCLLGLKYLRRCAPNLRKLDLLREKVSLRYLDVKAWAVIAPQLIEEVEGMERLESVRWVRAVEPREFTEEEMVRVRRLHELDARICDAAPKASPRRG